MSSLPAKNISLFQKRKSGVWLRRSAPDEEGASRSSRNVVRDAMDALARPTSGAMRAAKACGPDLPTPGSSSWTISRATVALKPGHRGERVISRGAIAQGMPWCCGVSVVTTLVCFPPTHTRLRVRRAPGFPCALFLSRDMHDAQLGHFMPRECGRSLQ
jgi:hypothetical protein